MPSFQKRQRISISTITYWFALVAIILGLGISFTNLPHTESKLKTKQAQHYIEQAASGFGESSAVQSLYSLGEQAIVSAILTNPYDQNQWHKLSDISFALGKNQQGFIALKIASRLGGKATSDYATKQEARLQVSPVKRFMR